MHFCLISAFMAFQLAYTFEYTDVQQAFLEFEIVPDVLEEAPKSLALVVFPSGSSAELGNMVSLSDTTEQPTVLWENYDESSYYTIVMVDPDAPSRSNPTGRSHLHWLITNVHSEVSGDVLATYMPPAPSPSTGPHRYTFLVYKQLGWVEFDETPILDTTEDSGSYRRTFDVNVFAQNYGLGKAIAGNFMQAENGY